MEQTHLANRMSRLENSTHADIVTLGDNQKQLEQAYKTIKTSNLVPKEVAPNSGTPNSSVTGDTAFSTRESALEGQVQQLRKQVEQLTRQGQDHTKTSRKNTAATAAKTGKWKQWTFWCHSHGSNLSHNSNNCTHRKGNHKDEATKDNPMGGNSSRDYLDGLYCHPVLHTQHTSPTP